MPSIVTQEETRVENMADVELESFEEVRSESQADVAISRNVVPQSDVQQPSVFANLMASRGQAVGGNADLEE